MNLWIFNHYAVAPDLPGGTRHYDLGRELAKRGHSVVIFASSFHHGQRQEMRLKPGEAWKVEDVGRVKFVWLKTFPYQRNDWRRVANMLSYVFQSYWLGRKMPELDAGIPKPDVIIGSSPHILTPLVACWLAKRWRARFIMEIRDLWPQTIIDMGKLSEHNPIIRLLQVLEKFLYNQAERIITLLPLAGEYIVARGIAKEKIVWIPNGVDLSKFASMEVKEPDGEFKVIYLGAHGQANDLGLVLDAAGIVQAHGYRDIKFVLIGDGPEKPNLMEKKGKLRLQNLEFHDPVPKSSVPKVLSEANATLQIMMNLPLHKYGLSANKLFDYMAASKPIILVGDIANDPIKSAYCGLTVPPRDPQALADAVIKLYEMPKEEREAMGRRGREYVEKYHAIPVLAHRLMRCLEEMP